MLVRSWPTYSLWLTLIGKTTEVDGEGKMDNNSASTSETIVSRSKSVKEKKSDLEEIKEQLKQMMALVPIVKELKEAYDSSSLVEEEGNEGEIESERLLWCEKEKCEPIELNITYCIKFLMSLYKQGYGYSALNSARSALSCIFNDPPVGEHQII